MLSVAFFYCYADCRYAECHGAPELVMKAHGKKYSERMNHKKITLIKYKTRRHQFCLKIVEEKTSQRQISISVLLLRSLPTYNRLGWIGLPGTNTQAYS
jgi:hypothetical protein